MAQHAASFYRLCVLLTKSLLAATGFTVIRLPKNNNASEELPTHEDVSAGNARKDAFPNMLSSKIKFTTCAQSKIYVPLNSYVEDELIFQKKKKIF